MLGTAKQFHSETADMKNSVKDRANAQSSCAGHFIEEHLVGDKWNWRKLIDGGDNDDDEESSGDGGDNGKKAQKQKGLWAHCDIAGTAWNGTRGTGLGVALLVELTRSLKI